MTTAVALVMAMAVLGLTLDVGRAYVIKNELQAFADAASIAAAFELDGTSAGVTRAYAAAGTGPTTGGAPPNRYDFATQAIGSVQVSFATTFGGTYQPEGSAAADSRFVQVTVAADSPIYFVRALKGGTWALNGTAVAGQALESTSGPGTAPFSPDAHTPGDPSFGFTVGQQYTLKWPPPGQRGKAGNTCSGDVGFVPPNSSSSRGYIDVGQGNGNLALHDAIVNNDFYLPTPYQVGSVIDWVPGNKNVGPGVDERFAQDTDQTSTTYATYTGNGRRILTVPVNDGADPATVVGFAAFFMPPGICGPQNTSPCCAEYLGGGVAASARKSAGGAGLYRVKLFR
jgi:putative Flp pilus-assembly TadE/G-like protein